VPHFPTPLFFFQGSAAEGRALLRHSWPELRAVADPNAELYQAFGIGRGGLLEMFGPGVWSGMSRAHGKGLSNGQRLGDIWRMPGTYLVADERILWMHEHRHAADRPDYAEISRLAAARTRAARATA
jgi:hypothetical protein